MFIYWDTGSKSIDRINYRWAYAIDVYVVCFLFKFVIYRAIYLFYRYLRYIATEYESTE